MVLPPLPDVTAVSVCAAVRSAAVLPTVTSFGFRPVVSSLANTCLTSSSSVDGLFAVSLDFIAVVSSDFTVVVSLPPACCAVAPFRGMVLPPSTVKVTISPCKTSELNRGTYVCQSTRPCTAKQRLTKPSHLTAAFCLVLNNCGNLEGLNR